MVVKSISQKKRVGFRMLRRLRMLLLVVTLSAIGALLVWAFLRGREESLAEQKQELPVNSPSRLSIVAGNVTISLDSIELRSSGLITQQLDEERNQHRINAFGTVLDVQDLINWRSSVVVAQSRLTKAEAAAFLSQKEFDRSANLHRKPGQISEEEYQISQERYLANASEVEASTSTVTSMQLTAIQKWGSTIATWLTEGSSIIDSLAKRSEALLLVTTPSGQEFRQVPGRAIAFTSDNTPIDIRLVSASPSVELDIQGASYYYMTSDKGRSFRTGLNVQVFLPTGDTLVGVVVPRPAVVWWQGKGWIYVERQSGQFTRRSIATDFPVAHGWFVADSSLIAESVVVSGAQTLLSEEFRSQVQVSE